MEGMIGDARQYVAQVTGLIRFAARIKLYTAYVICTAILMVKDLEGKN
jgi:hypothetical protein